VYGFTKALAIELAPYDITVNSVLPGGVNTPMIEGLLASPHAEWLQTLADLSGPSNLFGEGLMLESEEVTNVMLWLASDAAAFVTGHGLVIDGGYTIK
jgi:NAD(P)-dependent dehydrogenase (short-subunit alcohol dehydrogenase family)